MLRTNAYSTNVPISPAKVAQVGVALLLRGKANVCGPPELVYFQFAPYNPDF